MGNSGRAGRACLCCQQRYLGRPGRPFRCCLYLTWPPPLPRLASPLLSSLCLAFASRLSSTYVITSFVRGGGGRGRRKKVAREEKSRAEQRGVARPLAVRMARERGLGLSEVLMSNVYRQVIFILTRVELALSASIKPNNVNWVAKLVTMSRQT